MFWFNFSVRRASCTTSSFADKKITVLDFFAGSGTTGQAVLELNHEDGGERQVILVTNNENRICEKVTYVRMKWVIQGYTTPKEKEVQGIGGNIRYESKFTLIKKK